MTDSKLIKLTRPIVKPEWIYDCVKENVVKSHIPYLLISPNTSSALKFEKFAVPKKMVELDLNDPLVRSKVCTAQNFIQNYFNSSRLHHLSTWKLELIRFVDKTMKTRKFDVGKNVIMHIDMDCFFCSVAMRDRPDLVDKAVVVAHSAGLEVGSTADVASCNYIARDYGIKNGSSLGRAKELAPELVVLPYDFKAIIQCSTDLYKVLIKNCVFIKAVSCDEAYIAIKVGTDPLQIAENIKREIFEKTRCVASIGIGYSMLMARLATNRAKPNGIHSLLEADMNSIADFTISELPGVGWNSVSKLSDLNYHTIGDVQQLNVTRLKEFFGEMNGQNLYSYSRGIDTRPLENKLQQTIGAEINWAVRFKNEEEMKQFLKELCDEVYKRMKTAGISSRHVTVNAKKRNYKGEPTKYLGCGHCLDYSKSQSTDRFISNSHYLFQISLALLLGLKIPPMEIRGIGIHLKSESPPEQVSGQPTINFKPIRANQPIVPLESTKMVTTPKKRKPTVDYFSPKGKSIRPSFDPFEAAHGITKSQIDPEFVNNLPLEIRQELGLEPTENDSPLKYKEFVDDDYLPRYSQIDPDILQCLPKSVQLEQKAAAANRSKKNLPLEEEEIIVENESSVPMFGEESNVQIIWQKLRNWLNTIGEANPRQQDLSMLNNYLCSLVEDFELDNCCRILKEFNKKCRNQEAWNLSFMAVLGEVNSKVKDLYGNYLDSALFEQ